ncbi:MAG: SGNH hydrolase domain-containing protein [Chloroflexota bacterium]
MAAAVALVVMLGAPRAGLAADPPAAPSGSPSPAPTVAPAVNPSAPPGSGASASAPGGIRNPLPTPTPTPTPMPTITPPPRPAAVDGAVPASVLAQLSVFGTQVAAPYYDGCHVVMAGVVSSKPCLYGKLSSKTTIAIYGDSHALAWFPAVLRLAQARGWRVMNVTMSGCGPAEITQVYRGGGVMVACTAFHKAAIAKLARARPTMILVTGSRGFRTVDGSGHLLTGTQRAAVWSVGMKRALAKLIPIAKRVVLIADTPNSSYFDTTGCLRSHPRSVLACATSVTHSVDYKWLNTEYHVALAKHVAFIDAERWICRASPCSLVVGSVVTHRNSGHLSVRFMSSLWQRMLTAIDAAMEQPGVVIGP